MGPDIFDSGPHRCWQITPAAVRPLRRGRRDAVIAALEAEREPFMVETETMQIVAFRI